MENENDTFSLNRISTLMPYNSEDEIYKIIKQVTSLVPCGENKMFYLTTIFSILKDLVLGDEISQYTGSTMTKDAKSALDELSEYIRTSQLQEYRSVLEPLRKEVSKLFASKGILQSEISALELERKNLLVANASTSASLNQVQEEVAALQQKKDELSKSLNELQETIELYKKMMLPKYKVDWIPIPDDHPIYQTNYSSFQDYIEGLKQEYKDKMRASDEEVQEAFKSYMSCVEAIHSALRTGFFRNNYSSINRTSNGSLKEMVRTLKVPKYTLVKSMMDETPKNIGTLARELQYKREIALAEARAQAAEENLSIALNILKTQLPDVDLSAVLTSDLSQQVTIDNKPKAI